MNKRDEALSDAEVYELLQQCRHILAGRTAGTIVGYTALETILRDMDIVQTGLVMINDEAEV